MASALTSQDESVTESGTTMSPEQFELDARPFLDGHATKRPPETFVWGQGSDRVGLFPERTPEQEAADLAAARAWAQTVFDAGFGWITGPPAYGGRGLAARVPADLRPPGGRLPDSRRWPSTGSASAWWRPPSWPTPPTR